jgi:hypothetical protein
MQVEIERQKSEFEAKMRNNEAESQYEILQLEKSSKSQKDELESRLERALSELAELNDRTFLDTGSQATEVDLDALIDEKLKLQARFEQAAVDLSEFETKCSKLLDQKNNLEIVDTYLRREIDVLKAEVDQNRGKVR